MNGLQDRIYLNLFHRPDTLGMVGGSTERYLLRDSLYQILERKCSSQCFTDRS